MEKLDYFVPEHVESLNRLKAHYRAGISNAERCVLWKEILATEKGGEEVKIDELANLQVREDVALDCQNAKFINQCTSDTQDEVAKKLQLLITHYLNQNPEKTYHRNLICAAFPFLVIGLSLEEAYTAFTCFLKIFVPKFFLEDQKVLQSKADLLRLLILYHDPTLCSYMDQRGVSPISYVQDWWSVLFFETCTDLTTVLTLWDNIFLAWDPYLYFFISLVLIIRSREHIMAAEKEEIPLLIATTQIGDFTEVSRLVQHALSFSETTPHAFRCQLCAVTHQTPLFFDFLHSHLKTALCLSVGIQDVVTMKPKKEDTESTTPPTTTPNQGPRGMVRTRSSAHLSHTRQPSRADEYPKFAQEIFDCRSLLEFNAGRLPSSLHLDPEKLLARLGVPQYSSQHIALLPRSAQPGDEHALILRLLQFGVPYVSVISSGYEACHAMFREGRIYIESHNEASCLVCTGNSPPLSTTASSFISLPINNNSSENAISLNSSNNNINDEDKEKSSISSLFNSGKLSKMTASFMSGGKKLAENMNFKSLLKNDKDENRPLEDIDISGLDASDFRSIKEWRMYETNEIFPSKRIKKDGTHADSHILLNDRDLIFLEVHPSNPGYVRIYQKYNLSQLSQITYRKSKPQILRFKLEVPNRPHTPPPPSFLSPSPPPSLPFSPLITFDPTPSLVPASPPININNNKTEENNNTNNINSNNESSDFQDINLSPTPPHASVLIPPSSPAFHISTKTFFVEEPRHVIDAVHRKFERL